MGSIWVLAANSQHSEEAGKSLDFLVSPESAEVWAEQANIPLPVTIDTSTLEASPLLTTVIEALNSAASGKIQLGYTIDVLVPPEFNDAMLTGFLAMLAGDKTAEEQAADMQATWEEAIAE